MHTEYIASPNNARFHHDEADNSHSMLNPGRVLWLQKEVSTTDRTIITTLRNEDAT